MSWDGQMPVEEDVIVHVTWPLLYPEGNICLESNWRSTRPCKYYGLEYFLDVVSSMWACGHSMVRVVGAEGCMELSLPAFSPSS